MPPLEQSVDNAAGRVLEGLDPSRRIELSPLITAYLRHFDDSDRDPRELGAAILEHRELALSRPSGRARVALGSDHALLVVTDDMPFLVDSVTAAITGSGSDIEGVFHPQLVVRRSIEGQLLDVVGSLGEIEPGAGELAESWMRFEISPGTAAHDRQLIAAVSDALRDVREAVEDWQKMRTRALDVAAAVASDHAHIGLPQEEIDDTVELLEWLAADHFTFLGYRQYRLEGDSLIAEPGSGLGILRDDPSMADQRPLPTEVAQHARDRELLVLTKANSRSTVHRPVPLDYIGVKIFNAKGEVVGEHRFLGLYAATAYISSVQSIPVLRRKVHDVLQRSGFPPASHGAKDLLQILETFPRDELFQVAVPELHETAMAVQRLQERRQTRIFLRQDRFGRFVSALVYLPRDRYNTSARLRIESVLLDAFQATSIDYSAYVTESVLARLHFVVRMAEGTRVPAFDAAEIQVRVAEAVREWNDVLTDALNEDRVLLERYGTAFSDAFKSDFEVSDALHEISVLEELEPGEISVELRPSLLLVRCLDRIAISDLLPILSDFGMTVLEERPYRVARASGEAWIYALQVKFDGEANKTRFETALVAAWHRQCERDGLNQLVIAADLDWQQVAVLRAYLRYINQGALPFSAHYLQECLVHHADITRLLFALFEALHHPERSNAAAADNLRVEILTALDGVRVLDEDRILRAFLGTIEATLRTNAYVEHKALALKLDSTAVPELPDPRPAKEIWVSSPMVEGVHLRFGAVARGGLRWSDRREDFRTEVLGLVKAQMVKNSVIVPVGAKGGFVVRQSTATDREGIQAEGIAAYRIFIESLLDLTDNRTADGSILPPAGIIRRDSDDPYLVVAADKGTATFSDIANEISVARGFWLGDAFASGGSHGYDHKGMGITARGAWISVQNHFQELGRDPERDPITVVGIGDMSGDVFGNGMLRSRSMLVVAAFDHRHIFLDPNPNPQASFDERARLFALPRSSWADYDATLISAGGGVYARTEKSIPISSEVRQRLGLEESVSQLAPSALISAILTAPVDLLWNGGIGTYVKASTESHSDVGDKANDSLRVDGRDLRCLVVGEGGNLGLTQKGRIEYALLGGRINTDAIDNSAGVDTSDHEVNLKILFAGQVREGSLSFDERNALLSQMTDDVAAHVLADNDAQNLLLGVAAHQASSMLPIHQRLIPWLGQHAGLDRAVEALPTTSELSHRASDGRGLTRPELAVLAAYTKILLTREVLANGLADDAWWQPLLHSYFPELVRTRFGSAIDAHPLRREIISMQIANAVVNEGGITMIFRIHEETNAPVVDVVRAYAIAAAIFDSESFFARVREIADPPLRYDAVIEFRRLLERAVRWLVPWLSPDAAIGPVVDRYGEAVASVREALPTLLLGAEAQRLAREEALWVSRGVPGDLATLMAGLLDTFSALDIADIADSAHSVHEVASIYFALSDLFDIDALLMRVAQLPRTDRWDSLARSSMRAELYAALADLTRSVLRSSERTLAAWQEHQAPMLQRVRSILDEVHAADTVDLALLSVALRTIRGSLTRA